MPLAKPLFFFGLAILVVYCIWSFGFRDQLQTNRLHTRLQKLTSGDVLSIETGHQLIDKRTDIDSIVTLLNKNTTLPTFAPWVRGARLTINLKNGKKIVCQVSRYKGHSNDAVLDFDYPMGIAQVELHVPGLANAIDNLGAQLPESNIFVCDETGKIADGQISPKSLRMAPPHTLYNIERARDPLIASDDNNRAVLIIESCLLAFAVLYGYALCYPMAVLFKRGLHTDRDGRKNLLALAIFVVVLVGATIYVFDCGYRFNQAASHYKTLKTLLEKGKCKMLCGKLTDVRYIVKDHGAFYLYMIEIDRHRFFFSRRNIDQDLYGADDWREWAPEQLQLGAPLCLWYATIEGWTNPPEQVARVDVQ